jgi:hypothetical protein
MFDSDPKTRITLPEILAHPFFNGMSDVDKSVRVSSSSSCFHYAREPCAKSHQMAVGHWALQQLSEEIIGHPFFSSAQTTTTTTTRRQDD